MTTSLWSIWLSELNSRVVLQKRHILLFVYNASSHRMNSDISNIKIVFIPPNCTSVLQAMDQDEIWSFKCIFHKILLSFIVDSVNKIDVAQDLLR